MLKKLGCKKGDKLLLQATRDELKLRAYEERFALDMEMVDDIISKNKNMLKKLAEL